ncbi:MAG TPA: ABC transporter ATP-binding protein [Acidimicrobiales bacterium]|nr:ABC transporter ATP-binding protein [Acidimicrobiales bacterium]
MGALVECVAVTKAYDPTRPTVLALAGVDLSVQAGEMVAVMGPSGCGKSTLLHLLGGLDIPTTGRVVMGGQRIDTLSEARRAVLRRREVGYVFQFFNLIANLSVADNVELPMLLAGCRPDEASRRRGELLERLGVDRFADRPPGDLSGGQQQRVALARALANRPALLLADEPTGNLDSAATTEVLGLLSDYHVAGQTIVLVTHDPRVGAAGDRLVTMEDGLVRADEHRNILARGA